MKQRMSVSLLRRVLVVSGLFATAGVAAPAPGPLHFDLPRFGAVTAYRPAAEPSGLAIIISDDAPGAPQVPPLARALNDLGALVVALDGRRYRKALRARGSGECDYPAGDFENLSHAVQKRLGLRSYLRPYLVGVGPGAALAYATMAQAPHGTFVGGIAVGGCLTIPPPAPALCGGNGPLRSRVDAAGALQLERLKSVRDPWVEVGPSGAAGCSGGQSAFTDSVPALQAAYRRMASRAEPEGIGSPGVADLPIIEVPPTARSSASSRLALLMTGDGGWAGLDQDVAARLAATGVPVAGFNSLKYFWKRRTPEEVTADVQRTLHHYLDAWDKREVILIGYSFGADVMPFVVNRLPADLRERIAAVVLISLAHDATFEVQVTNWIPGLAPVGVPTAPEIARLPALPLLCLFGEGETTLCPSLPSHRTTSEQIGHGHHLGGEYDQIADRILRFVAELVR